MLPEGQTWKPDFSVVSLSLIFCSYQYMHILIYIYSNPILTRDVKLAGKLNSCINS